jgi:hypothetical protein
MIPYEDFKKANAPFMDALADACKRCVESGWYVLSE